jgi:hypothetical protein
MQTHADVTARLDQLVNQLPLKDQQHLTAVVERMMKA